jgi:hypothetical protein
MNANIYCWLAFWLSSIAAMIFLFTTSLMVCHSMGHASNKFTSTQSPAARTSTMVLQSAVPSPDVGPVLPSAGALAMSLHSRTSYAIRKHQHPLAEHITVLLINQLGKTMAAWVGVYCFFMCCFSVTRVHGTHLLPLVAISRLPATAVLWHMIQI